MTFYTIRDLGDFGTNSYIIETPEKNAILIDAPYSARIISRELERFGISLKKILLTHGHCDHIEALGGLVKQYGCEVLISPEDEPMLRSRRLCLAEYFGTDFTPFDGAKTFSDGDTVELDGIKLKVVATPGHSAGSVCFVGDGLIFTGDTLFKRSIGRTDLGGDYPTLIDSVAKLYRLGENYGIYPGHGSSSDLDTELRLNPYLGPLRDLM